MPLELPNGMDYVNDLPMSDPFLCLDTDLDDVSGEMSTGDLGMWPEANGVEPKLGTDPLLSSGQLSHSPQQLSDPNIYKEIGSIVSLLQEGDHMFNEANNYHHFMNENLHNENPLLNSDNDAANGSHYSRMAVVPSAFSYSHYQGVQFLKTPTQNGGTFGVNGMQSDSEVKKERWQSNGGDFTINKAHNTKQELLDLIATMTPAEVEHLRASRCTSSYSRRHPMAVGVATKMPLTIGDTDMASPTRHGSETGSVLLSPRTSSSTASADLTVDTNDFDMDADFGSSNRRGPPKTERRTAHNLIEKKYRCSINDRIQCLKTMLSGEDAKLSKSATLRKAIEHISALRHENEQLHHEVERLRQMLKANGIEDGVASLGMQPPTSLTSNSISSSHSNQNSSECSSTSVHPKRSRTMVDKSRVTMLAFMFALVIWNPVSLFIDSSYPSTAPVPDGILHPSMPGRSLQQAADAIPFDTAEAETIWWRDTIVRPCFVWSVNVFIIFCFLTRVLVYGEPVADAKSSSWTLFLNTKSAAETYIKRGNYNEAGRQLRECLRVLERPLPTAGFDELISVLWQVIRHLLNGVWIGRWFARRKRSPAKPVTVVCRSHAHTALIYHQLHQLHLIGVENMGDGLTGLNMALCAVNLAESAGCSPDGLSHAHRADIYLNAALRVRITLPSFIGIPLYVYFMRRARRHARLADKGILEGIAWVFHPLSRKFLSSPHLIEYLHYKHDNHFPFVNSSLSMRPLERLTSAFKMELLANLLSELSSPATLNNMRFVDVSHLLLTICTAVPQKTSRELSSFNNIALNTEGDELCTWWTHVFTCALYWKHGDNVNAHKHYTLVRRCPRQLLDSYISLAVGHAFCSRKLCVDDRSNRHFTQVVWAHATRSFSFFHRIDPEKICARISPAANAIHNLARSVSLEWLLMSVLDVWHSHMNITKPYWEQPPIASLKQLYEQILTQFRMIARNNEDAHYKVVVFELASRMLNAANPVSIWGAFVRVARHERVATCKSRGMDILCCPSSAKYTRFSNVLHIDILRKLHSDINTFTMIP